MTDSEFQQLLALLAQTPQALERHLSQTPAEHWGRKIGEDFSLVENICHLRDLEIEGYTERIRLILAEDEPALADFDGGRVARERNYPSQSAEAALAAFAAARAANVTTLREVSPAQRARMAQLKGAGRITLERLAQLMREHDSGHLAELEEAQRASA
jgi:DinB superfamily